jgi:hypothetical protein
LRLNCFTGSPIHFYFSAQALSRNLHKRFCESHFAGRTKHGATEFWLTLGLILLVYQVELNVLVPGVLGKEMRLHPVPSRWRPPNCSDCSEFFSLSPRRR